MFSLAENESQWRSVSCNGWKVSLVSSEYSTTSKNKVGPYIDPKATENIAILRT
jgi:hypothetical protein